MKILNIVINKKFKYIHLIGSLALLYRLTYLIFIKTTNRNYFFGVIPEILIYVISVYFISCILVEIILEKSHPRNLKIALKNAFILLAFLLMYCGIYLMFHKYVITPKHLEDTFFGNIANFIFLFFMIFSVMRLSKRLYRY